jgi:hypothetical protein
VLQDLGSGNAVSLRNASRRLSKPAATNFRMSSLRDSIDSGVADNS